MSALSDWFFEHRGKAAWAVIGTVITTTVSFYYGDLLRDWTKTPQVQAPTPPKHQVKPSRPPVNTCAKELIENRSRTAESQKARDGCRADYKREYPLFATDQRAATHCTDFEISLAVAVALGNEIEARCRPHAR
jgi:hypothetical protein